MRRLAGLIGVLALATVGSAWADVLWGKAVHGASPSDVAAAHPEGRPFEFLPESKARLKSGAVKLYEIPSLEISGEQFKVDFFFLENKLEQVSLSHKKIGISSYQCEITYTALLEALVSKYGAPLLNRRQSSGFNNATFAAGAVSVALDMWAFDSLKDCSVYAHYNKRVGTAASKL